MKNTKISLLLIFVSLTVFSFGQKVVSVEGNCDFIKGEKEIKIVYDYSEMSVGKFNSEEDYVNEKVAEGNKKEAGKGDKWKDSWYGSRERVYHVKFETLFNKGLAKRGITGSQDADGAKYTLIVKTTFTEPGFNVGVMKRPSAINVEYIFVETGTENVIAKFTQEGIPGSQAAGFDYDTSTRISESYAKAGKMLAAYIYKKTK